MCGVSEYSSASRTHGGHEIDCLAPCSALAWARDRAWPELRAGISFRNGSICPGRPGDPDDPDDADGPGPLNNLNDQVFWTIQNIQMIRIIPMIRTITFVISTSLLQPCTASKRGRKFPPVGGGGGGGGGGSSSQVTAAPVAATELCAANGPLRSLLDATGDAAIAAHRKKNGSQQAMKLPMISPRMSVARFSFLRAIRRFSFSGSRGFGFGGSAGSTSLQPALSACLAAAISCVIACWPPPPPLEPPPPESIGVVQLLLPPRPPPPATFADWRAFAFPLPKIGWQRRNLSGFTTAQRLITPESELDGSNSLTMSVSIPTERARERAAAADGEGDTGSGVVSPFVPLVRPATAGPGCVTFSVSFGSWPPTPPTGDSGP
uniref:Uncharacterized protein n=1 Tax=Anopheles farauti TaxID=69004 RepID=A0A182R0C1_9DIPT